MKRVLIIEAQMKQYRLPFYERLFSSLSTLGIELRVAYSDPHMQEALKRDCCDLPPSYGRKVRGRWIIPGKVLFQPLLTTALAADLVILEQANKFLLNHFLLPLSLCGIKQVAFFGHGRNGQEDSFWLSEFYRRRTLNWVAWWFAYTATTTTYLTAHGVPLSKITTVFNAINTEEIREQVTAMPEQHRNNLRSKLGIPMFARVGLYCGGFDAIKKIPFLIEAAKLIQKKIPDFQLVLIGSGPEQPMVESVIRGLEWIRLIGSKFGREKSELMAISDVMLVPGAVGLVILDAFAAGLPLLSTRLKIHGPEMEYLDEGVNGLLSEPDVTAFANMTISLLQNRESLERLRRGARESGSKYTIENMVNNFKTGIECCLHQQSSSQVSALNDGIA